ncbi:MAG TPA: FAD-dependent oxidoreductase [Spirochaetota bacterium]|nr:FAD-dependent oxidoreductase [Spirochaetota bacterium]HPC39571.1 FAD-dependent oxidoreductase [Spirochaetota bacterium]HPL19166.1 FAD-dependent oxidoreductase [Spirochaetota bacterium]HQF09466.1 FAD-dependent oxidoreductase [Spirochaetota bacterium]HQH98149.1 FAD-dependent oxidoreductase [Spirochaetota bacterium]
MSELISYINASQFESEVLGGGSVVLDFYSTECPPCEALAAKFEPLSELYGKDIRFMKMFRQENRPLAEKLGVMSSPTVIFFKDGKEVGQRLSGGIRRSDLVGNLELLIDKKKADELRAMVQPVMTDCDILIIGGGPTGLTAGIYAAQAKVKTILVDQALPGGQVTTTHLVSNYPGFEKPVEGFMLTHFMTEQAKHAGVEFRQAVEVTNVDLAAKTILVDGFETIRAKRIIIATGSSYRELNVPGEAEYKGKGISYCATCDAKYYDNKEVVVIGGGNSAVEESLFITRFARKVTIVHQFDKLQANKEAQEKAFANPRIEFIFEHEPRAFERRPDGGMDVTIEDLKTGERRKMATDGVFIFAGLKPNISIFNGALKLDQWGYVAADELLHTNVPGVFAAGDVRSKPYRQITTAVADGTVAAITAVKEVEAMAGY